MDWVSAWDAAMPVFGFALVLHALFPLFAVPVWIIFYLYASKILVGARLAEDPWGGRGSPRPYAVAGALALAFQVGGVALFAASGSLNAAVTGTIAGIGALTLPALFLAGAAPPGVRDRRGVLRLGVALGAAASLVAPGVLFGALPFEGTAAAFVYLGQIGLAGASFAAFAAARRLGARRPVVAARKVPRA